MTLTIDIGNTMISFALLKGTTMKRVWSVETTLSKNSLKTKLKTLLERIKRNYPLINQVIICSVVPKIVPLIKSAVQQKFNIKPTLIGADRKVPIKNRYRNPRQVGQDRLVCAYAAMRLYGAPAIVIDFGTAITFDVVSGKGEYLGGIIVPGIRLSAESLFRKTAMLPKISIQTPRTLIGRDTQTSILSGIFYGYGALCGGLIEAISKPMKRKPKVILTGGYARLMRKFISKKIHTVDPDLVYKGMALLAHSES